MPLHARRLKRTMTNKMPPNLAYQPDEARRDLRQVFI